MNEISYIQYKKWLKKRKRTTIAFSIQMSVLGMEYSLTFLTLWLYITNLLNIQNKKIWYGLISVSYHIFSIFTTLAVSRFIDRTRNIKQIFIVCNSIVIIGNLLYSLPYSPWCLLLGRALASFAGSLRSPISAEVIRSYPPEQLGSILSLIGGSFATGFVVGPGLNFFFQNVDFTIFSWHVSYENVTGLYMAFIFALMLATSVFAVDDLSKEFDLKAAGYVAPSRSCTPNYTQSQQNLTLCYANTKYELSFVKESESIALIGKQKPTSLQQLAGIKQPIKPVYDILLQMISNFDCVLILFTTFFGYFMICAFDMWIPMLFIDVLNYTIIELNVFILAGGLSTFLLLLVFVLKPLRNVWFYKSAVFTLATVIYMQIVIMLLYGLPGNAALNVTTLSLFALFFGAMVAIEEVFLINTVAKMADASIQAFTEAVRLTMHRAGAATAFLSAPFLFDYIQTVGSVFIAVVLIVIILLLRRRKYFSEPHVIIQ